MPSSLIVFLSICVAETFRLSSYILTLMVSSGWLVVVPHMLETAEATPALKIGLCVGRSANGFSRPDDVMTREYYY